MDNPALESSTCSLNENKPVLRNSQENIVRNYNSTTTNDEEKCEVMKKLNEIEGEAAAVAVPVETAFPKHVFLIILSEFCERFSYYGLRTVLVIYFTQFIMISDNQATAYFHAFTMLCYFTPIFGAILADGYIGKFKTILFISIVYLIGEVILFVTAIKPLGAPNLPGPLVGLLLIGLGTGGIKPCVSAFGGDQFGIGQQRFLETFFSMFYLSINVGAFIGSILTPILRSDVKCFDENCYPLAFGVPAGLMLAALVLFVLGKPLYTFKKVNREDNVFKKLFFCMTHALKMRFKNGKTLESNAHWLDYAQDKYDRQFIEDVKAFCKVVFMFLPVPVFWALFDQQGSRWTLQAQKLNSYLGMNIYLKADQIQAINPVFILILIPTFNWIVYPLFNKCKILTKPLQRMTVGMLLACVAFCASAFLEYKIQDQFMTVNSQPNAIQVLNLSPHYLQLNSTVIKTSDRAMFTVNHNEAFYASLVNRTQPTFHSLKGSNNKFLKFNYAFYMRAEELKIINVISSIEHEPIGKSQVRVYFLNTTEDAAKYTATLKTLSKDYKTELNVIGILDTLSAPVSTFKDIDFDEYELTVRLKGKTEALLTAKYRLDNGARYTLLLYRINEKLNIVPLVDIQGNQVNFAFQFIQYFIITCGEIMFSISGLSFAYSQAPESMKSLLQAAWLLTVAFGNLIVFIIAEADLIKNQVHEYILFAALILVSAVVFSIMSYFYVYTDTPVAPQQGDANEKVKFTNIGPRNSDSSEVQLVRMTSIEQN